MPHQADIDIGIIGGSGIYDIDGFSKEKKIHVDTPFGEPSDAFAIGEMSGIKVAFLPRHGRNHLHLPSELNYRANIYGFKALGVSKVIGITAVGSLREHIEPIDLVIPDQLIDRTTQRASTFFGQGIAAHIPFAQPFCPELSVLLYEVACSVTSSVHRGGTLVSIEGPAFSTKAESHMYRQWGCDIIGMTTFQEAKLAREAELCYAALAMVTDYDCWKEGGEEDVTVGTVVANMKKNSANARQILADLLPRITTEPSCLCSESLVGAVMTAPAAVTQNVRDRLSLLLGDRIKPLS